MGTGIKIKVSYTAEIYMGTGIKIKIQGFLYCIALVLQLIQRDTK